MDSSPGQDPGHGFSWREYVDGLVETHGSLAAVASLLARNRAYADDAASIERALRRLKARSQLSGGIWGERALLTFGLPAAADARTRWMGVYHSRFTDLPLSICRDLVRMWDRPPVSEAPAAATWLALAHASCALRGGDLESAAPHLRRARASFGHAPVEARIETMLVEAFVASRNDGARVAPLLEEVGRLLDKKMPPGDRACLYARWIDQRAYALSHAGAHTAAEAFYESLPKANVPPFALYRRASGLAWARWKAGDAPAAVAFAEEACEHAGDGGHLRLRAMALAMLGRFHGRTDEGKDARVRVHAIVAALEDEALRVRFRL